MESNSILRDHKRPVNRGRVNSRDALVSRRRAFIREKTKPSRRSVNAAGSEQERRTRNVEGGWENKGKRR